MRVWITCIVLAAAVGGPVLGQTPEPVPPPPQPAPAPAPPKPADPAAKPATGSKPPAKPAIVVPTLAERCAPWVVNGYKLGMTIEEASVLRPVTTESKDDRVRLVAQETLKGTLTFNAAGKLISWEGEFIGADPESVKTAALEKWGVPRRTDAMGQLRKVRRKNWLFYKTTWQAVDCDTRIVMEIGRYTPKRGNPLRSVTMLLTVPPDNERKDEFKKQQGDDWLK